MAGPFEPSGEPEQLNVSKRTEGGGPLSNFGGGTMPAEVISTIEAEGSFAIEGLSK